MKEEPDFFEPDKHHLDTELVRQPQLYWEHAERLADTRRDHERAEAEKDLTWAELDAKIRGNPGDWGLDKVTESSVEQAIVRSTRYQKAVANAIDKKHDMDVAYAAVTALDHRKRALEKLVDLRLAEYYADPILPKGERGKMEDRAKREARTAGQKRQRGEDDDS